MIGKVLTIGIVAIGIVTAISVYYLQVYHYYDRVDMAADQVRLVPAQGDTPQIIDARNIRAIDADSSPIRFRACFRTDLTPDAASDRYRPVDAQPLNGPGWFDCFDAAAIGAALAAGQGATFLAEKNVAHGADRVVAILDGGRGYIWHQLNNCGEKAYDGTQVGEDCPEQEASQ